MRNTANNWFMKRVMAKSNQSIPLSNMYSKTGTNHFARKIRHENKSKESYIVGEDFVNDDKIVGE